MKRKSITKEVIKKPHIQAIAKVILKEYGLEKAEKKPIAAMLALAWIAGAQTSLAFPELTSLQLVGSEEVYELTKGGIERAIKKALGSVTLEVLKEAMRREQYLFPFTRLEFDDYSYFVGKN
jgi:hypothetical protein